MPIRGTDIIGLDGRFVNIVGDTMSGALTIDLANATALSLGTLTTEGGNIIVYQDIGGHKALEVDPDVFDTIAYEPVVTILDPTDDDLSVNSNIALRLYGHDYYALQLGDDVTEGGDIIVYKDTAGNPAFELDADGAAMALNTPIGAETKFGITMDVDDLAGINLIGISTEAFTGTGWTRGIYARRDVSATGSTTVATNAQGLYFQGINYRNNDGVSPITYGAELRAFDYGDWLETAAIAASRTVYGGYFYGLIIGDDNTSLDNTSNLYGGYFYGLDRVKLNKAAGTHISNCYGGYFYGRSAPTLTAGTLTLNTYGGYFEALGTTVGTQTAYGGYFTASGADVNWAGYFVGNVKIEGDITILDAKNIVLDTVTGTKIGTGATQKLGFFGVIPVVQQAHIIDADGTLADITIKFNTLLSQLEALGLLASV